MNESANRGTTGEAIVGVVLLFVILIILLYRYGSDRDTVSNPSANNQDKELLLAELTSSSSDKELYNKYIQQIYELQSGTANSPDVQGKISALADSFKNDLEAKVTLPPQTIHMKNVSDKFSVKNYSNNFEIIFQDFKKREGTTEGQILAAQVTSDGTILPLSEYDKESLLRLVVEYEIFAEKMQNLSTPKSRENLAVEIAAASLNISYILGKIVEEKDTYVYPLWISKYAENMSVIIAGRYAIQQGL